MKPSRVLLVVILAVAAFDVGSFGALGDSVPTVESSGEQIVAWFSANGTAARTYAWCLAFFSLGLGICGGLVADQLPRGHAFVCFGGVMNVYLGGLIGFLRLGGLTRWAMMRLDSSAEPESTG